MARLILASLVLPFTVAAQSGNVRFVQFGAPDLENPGKAPGVTEAARYLEKLTALGWAVLETNRLDLRNRLDFVVISMDAGASEADSASVAMEYARVFNALTVSRLYLLASKPLSQGNSRWMEFVSSLQSSLPSREVIDLSGTTVRSSGFTLVGLWSAASSSPSLPERKAELARITKNIVAGSPALIFASLPISPQNNNPEAPSLWPIPEWEGLIRKADVCGAFAFSASGLLRIPPSSPAKDRGSSTPRTYLAPGLSTDSGANGLLYVRAGRDCRVDAVPFWMGREDDFAGEGTLPEAGIKEQDGEYQAAYDLYKESMKSNDPDVRVRAEAGLRRTDEALQGFRERWKSEFPPAHWFSHHWREVSVAALLLAIYLAVTFTRQRARVEMAAKLGEEAPAELFMLHFIDAGNVIHGIWAGTPGTIPEPKSKVNVTFSTRSAEAIADGLKELKIPGVDLQGLFKWVPLVWRWMSWRLELSVYGTEAQTVVYARLRFAGRTHRTWMQPTSLSGPLDVRGASWALMCDVIWSGVRLR